MNTKTISGFLGLLLITACGGLNRPEEQAAPEATFNPASHLVNSTLWYQHSDEAEVLYHQVYNHAGKKLLENLDRNIAGKKPAVILDIDETVLDNSPYEARLVEDADTYSSRTWAEWVRERKAGLLPGVKGFLNRANALGVEVFYISNRSSDLIIPTIDNLEKFGLPNVDTEHVLLKVNTSDKTARRQRVKKDHKVVLLIGDQMTDFAENYQEILNSNQRDSLFQHFVVLPNPMYGGFLDKAYEGAVSPGEERKMQLREEALEKAR